jgi:2-dehydro-3-deoxygluconokinase
MSELSGSTSPVQVRPAQDCRFDELSLGDVMLRLDPGDNPVRTARQFRAWEGGGEYNVARALRRCFGLRTAVVTALADNEVGRLIEDLMLQGGVDLSFLRWVPFEGIGRRVRNGLNFTARGFGVRGAVGTADRANNAASQIRVGEVDWEHIFGELGVRWFHTGGIYAALSETTPDVIEEAMHVARRHGTVISYDLNYRPSLWNEIGGKARAREVNRNLAPLCDVMLGNEEDFTASLGIEVPGGDPDFASVEMDKFKQMIEQVTKEFPNLKVVATSLRTVRTATVNDWAAIGWCSNGFAESIQRPNLEVFDRVGGGDGFASGLIYGLMEKGDLEVAVNYGAAHGALVMTTPGDTSTAKLAEVENLMKGGSVRIQR